MTERQKGLVKDYGPRFIARVRIIQNEILKLAPDALSIFTDEEWSGCAEIIDKLDNELNKLEGLAEERVEETIDKDEDFIDLYRKARESVKRFI